ncbi:alkaline phosphatase PhoX [Glycomyces salinus]|uniref:alkaline phosphatase PhoX n=1 Tax=Glycomyces salinus TaxID=980294 RepID=UPI0018EBC587|nr:alkaline phosphatase PhoX [Glycomyces salinus]
MDRREIFRAAVIGVGSVALGFTMTRSSLAVPTESRPSRYGRMLPADDNGLRLPEGFTSRAVARTGKAVGETGHRWHGAPDGGACFPDGDGWIYVSNSELDGPGGGAGAIRFDSGGAIVDSYTILEGTRRNCAGGPTPWRSWLSCEEIDRGFVYETDPYGEDEAERRPAMGRFAHEAAACDPDRKVVYLTEDKSKGCFYRFVPDTWGDLSSGTLQVLAEHGSGLEWADVPDPLARREQTRDQVPHAKDFDGGEGCCYADGICFFTTKGDNRVWAYHAEDERLEKLYEERFPLRGVDNVTVSEDTGDLFVAEDGDNMEICVLGPDRSAAAFLRVVGHAGSEITGPAFDPAGRRLYFSSQRGRQDRNSDGYTFEVAGPFRSA